MLDQIVTSISTSIRVTPTWHPPPGSVLITVTWRSLAGSEVTFKFWKLCFCTIKLIQLQSREKTTTKAETLWQRRMKQNRLLGVKTTDGRSSLNDLRSRFSCTWRDWHMSTLLKKPRSNLPRSLVPPHLRVLYLLSWCLIWTQRDDWVLSLCCLRLISYSASILPNCSKK